MIHFILEFIHSIMSCNEKKWQKLIIQDLARLLEHKFRDFKKTLPNLHSSLTTQTTIENNLQEKKGTTSIFVNTDLFTYIASKIFELASEEPNGILGTVINLRLQCDNGCFFDICQGLPYEPSTMATSEITIVMKEDVTSMKRFLQTFRLYANIGKYFALQIDSKNFDVYKARLY